MGTSGVITTWSLENPLFYWLLSWAVSFICFIITANVFCRERQKRKDPDHLISSKYLSISSYLCIIIGPTLTLLRCAGYLPGCCLLYRFLGKPLGYLQFVAMECYQLSRLYYCFSRSQVHSNKGYPKWMFAALFCVLLCWFVVVLTMTFSRFTTQCYIDNDGNVNFEGIYLFQTPDIVRMTVNILYIGIECTTVALYWCKVRSLRKHTKNENGTESKEVQDRAVYDRIQSILYRVLILTFFYFVISLVSNVIGHMVVIAMKVDDPFGAWYHSIGALSLSYSMFLMQDHNTSEYVAFLQIIKRSKCVLCFCCFGHMIKEQCRMLVDNVDEETKEKERSIQTANTRNISADVVYGIQTTGIEMSTATKTVCEPDSEQMADDYYFGKTLEVRV